ncbi:MAG: nickel-dependent lactate racemase [Candidatus Bathyarchaeota archaeon]|nr:nickel-dependent lactate racemase [Candidatus Termiticorpusculum sp.]
MIRLNSCFGVNVWCIVIVMVDVWLPYGKTDVCIRVPARNLLGSIVPVQKSSVSDSKAEIERALKEPIGASRLSEIVAAAKPESKVALLVDDVACKSPDEFTVLSVLSELNLAGVKDENVTIILGCNVNSSYTSGVVVKPEDYVTFLGAEVLSRVKVVTHDAAAKDLVYVGTTKSHGNKVFLNSLFAEADIKILLSDVNVHYYAGYSGGGKSVVSGVSGVETIRHNSVLMLNSAARAGVLDGNPVSEDLLEVARMAKVDFVVNLVRNSKGEIVKVFAGDLEAAFLEAVKLVDEIYKVSVDRRADIVVVSAGGYPVDVTLYQAYKAVDNVLDVVKRGGVIVLVAECSKGHGNQVFYDWMARLTDFKSTEKEIKRNFAMGGHKAYCLLKVLQNHPIILVSSLPDYYATNVFKLKTARAVNDALTEAFKLAGSASRVWVVPAGSHTLPEYKSPEETKT